MVYLSLSISIIVVNGVIIIIFIIIIIIESSDEEPDRFKFLSVTLNTVVYLRVTVQLTHSYGFHKMLSNNSFKTWQIGM